MSGAAAAVNLKLMRVAALLDSDPRAAARETVSILREHPGNLAATLLLGTAQRGSGDLESAAQTFAELVRLQPDSAVNRLELGRTLAALGRHEEALEALHRAVALEPNLAEGWRDISVLQANRGDTEACDRAYAHYYRLAMPEQHLGEAGRAIANGRLAAAETLLRTQLATSPQDVVAMRMLAEVAFQREDYLEAERLLGACLKVAPGDSAARFDLARILHSQQKAEPILPLVERLLVLAPEELRYRSMQASAYSLLGQNERATEILGALVHEHPEHEMLWLSYGHANRVAGRIDAAVAAYRKSAQLRPSFGEAWFSLANLKTFRFSAADLEAMQQQLARQDLQDNDRLQFEFALAKALEDSGNFRDSFQHYAQGNALRHAVVQYDRVSNTRLVERIKTLFTADFIGARAGAGFPAPDPIFVIGMPRAGSTLVEQILASHSQVEGTRELPDIPGFALELGARDLPGHPPAYPQTIARLTRRELAAYGERYIAQTRANRRLDRPRFIDKMPSNFFHVGLIHLILPNARIIDVRRSALGCCFANFKQHFQSGVWFSYDLEDIGHYYRDYVHLMTHFDSVLPGRVHRVQYEKVVADLEGEVRKLLDYCGLPFEEQCLRFHETRRVVHTASSEQVRRPLYAEGVDQWRNFEPWLGKLRDALGDVT